MHSILVFLFDVFIHILVVWYVILSLPWSSILPTVVLNIDYSKAPAVDWPALKIVELEVSTAEITKVCGAMAMACAAPYFHEGECRLYLPTHPPEWILRHERAHCLGYDHYWYNIMHDAWAEYKKHLHE